VYVAHLLGLGRGASRFDSAVSVSVSVSVSDSLRSSGQER
jgi:hypothetical protein